MFELFSTSDSPIGFNGPLSGATRRSVTHDAALESQFANAQAEFDPLREENAVFHNAVLALTRKDEEITRIGRPLPANLLRLGSDAI